MKPIFKKRFLFYDNGNSAFQVCFKDLPVPENCSEKVVPLDYEPQQSEHFNQFYLENDEIKFDETWSLKEMPLKIIKSKNLKNTLKNLDGELAKETPDPVVVARLQRDHDKCKDCHDELFWAEKALAGLERAEIDKPVIRQKLEEKISKLRGES